MTLGNISITKQKAWQYIIGAGVVVGALATALPQIIPALPVQYQKYGVATLASILALEKILVMTGQVIVGPQKVQSPATQDKLNALPDQTAK